MSDHNFIDNGSFDRELEGWEISDERKVTHQEGQWRGETVGFMDARNTGEGSQTITLATRPRPEAGKAEYRLVFWYEAVANALGTLRINLGSGAEYGLDLVPSLVAGSEKTLSPRGNRLDLNLVRYPHPLTLERDEATVKFTVISPDNGGAGRPGAVRFTFAQVLLHLEPLQLDSLTVDGESQVLDKPLPLCFGGGLEVALQVNGDNAWLGTSAGLLVENEEVDPDGLLDAAPPWGIEHPIDQPWTISSQPIMEDTQIERILAVRSQYTAEKYLLNTVCGHFRLDVIPVKEAAYYPVLDLRQSVEVVVQVVSHFTRMPLANREVTFTLKGPGKELRRWDSDENGEVRFPWQPDQAGDWEIEAKVDSYYKPEEALYTFAVRVLKADPWLSANFSLDGPSRQWIWGNEPGYANRGASHEVTVEFPAGHALSESELALHLKSEDTPEGLGLTFDPELEIGKPLEGDGLAWKMACKNRRDSEFGFTVGCSKLLEASPVQTLHLGHNSVVIGNVKSPPRFPVVGSPRFPLAVQIVSTVAVVGPLKDVPVKWNVDGEPIVVRTGEDGWVQVMYDPASVGPVRVEVTVASPYDDEDPVYVFVFNVLEEDIWSSLVTVTLNGHEQGSTGLICFHHAAPTDLVIRPLGEEFVGENICFELVGEDGRDLKFTVEPAADLPRKLPAEGLTWKVGSTSEVSSRFELHVFNEHLEPHVLRGLLLSTQLQDAGMLALDDKVLSDESTVCACIGAEHNIKFTPMEGSLVTGLDIAARLASGDSLGMALTPVEAREIPSAGVQWKLDARNATESGEQGIVFSLPQAGFTYARQAVSLDHNRIEISGIREPSFDPVVGETVDMQIKTRSFYTRQSVPELIVTFRHGEVSTPVRTQGTGWSVFRFTTTRTGPVTVSANVPSPYDGPEGTVSHEFSFEVLGAGGGKSITLADEE